MYDREYQGKELNFEPSGGLMPAALVMQDKETDSYWSIMTADAIAGDLKETTLKELPVSTKAQWKIWFAMHPDTVVLSVDGREHIENNPYDKYFSSEDGYRSFQATDKRLSTKTPIYAFQRAGRKYAVPFKLYQGLGAGFALPGGYQIFLFRPYNVAIFHSTIAFITDGPGFAWEDGKWKERSSGAIFDSKVGTFIGATAAVQRLRGFDTFWYNWSLTHPDTKILKRSRQ